jgi:hypothetical protein
VALAGRLGAEDASRLLERVLPSLEAVEANTDPHFVGTRLRLIERAMFFAAHFDRSDLLPAMVDRLVRLIESEESAALESVGPAVGQTLRGLRKLGLRDETARILDRMAAVLTRGLTPEQLAARSPRTWPKMLQSLLHLAAAWLAYDQPGRAEPVLVAARSLLARSRWPGKDAVLPADYAKVLCGLVTALGQLPPAQARGRIAALFEGDLLDRLLNTQTVRDFYSWLHLNVVEEVVLTLASDSFSLGPVARRWLDEDEYLVRRRVHRDVRAALERA